MTSRSKTHTTLVVSNRLGKRLGTFIDDDVSPTILARLARVDNLGRVVVVANDGNHRLGLETGFAHLTHDGRAVDAEVAQVRKEFLRTVLRLDKLEELGSVIDKRGPGFARLKHLVREETDKEGNVGLDTADTELDERSEHLAAGDFVGGTAD